MVGGLWLAEQGGSPVEPRIAPPLAHRPITEPGCEAETLALDVAEDGDFRLDITGWKETGLGSTRAVKLFTARGDLTSTKPPRVTAFQRGPWEREVLALDA